MSAPEKTTIIPGMTWLEYVIEVDGVGYAGGTSGMPVMIHPDIDNAQLFERLQDALYFCDRVRHSYKMLGIDYGDAVHVRERTVTQTHSDWRPLAPIK